MSVSVLDEDLFEVKEINKDGKFFEKVSRVHASSDNYETEVVLDIASEVYPLPVGTKFHLMIASSLNTDGTPDDGAYDQSGRKTLADKYEFVMCGRVFKLVQGQQRKAAYASFGGLLMEVKGENRNMQGFETDQLIYLLVRRLT